MPQVTIRIYQNDGSAASTERILVRTKYVDTKSGKGLTGKSAARIIKREFPEFVLAGRVFVIKSEGGWKAMRTVQSTDHCSYHFIWEEVLITQDA